MLHIEDWFEEDDYEIGRNWKFGCAARRHRVSSHGASSSIYSLGSGRSVSRELERPWSTVKKNPAIHFEMLLVYDPRDANTEASKSEKHVLNLLADFWREWKLMMRILGKSYGQMRHIYLNGAVNTQKCCIWCTSLPNVLQQQPLHSDYLTACPSYSELLQQQVIPALQERQCLQITIFMQDEGIPPIERQVKALLSAKCGDNRVISRHFLDTWPFRTPYLNPCDFCLCVLIKDHVYNGGIRTLPDLKASIIRHGAEIPRELLLVTIGNATMRFQHVIDVNGAHI
ncbi:uncharacterized protein TNCV_395851 [Trichonephila clavipes]|nr:uncharacterized protein TNCV_395851 [Trichonephila clavipes]